MSRGLGINKDLEPLARRVRRMGGRVEINRRNHVVWTMPDGTCVRSGLTMSGPTAKHKQIEIERALAVSCRAGGPLPGLPLVNVVGLLA